MGRGRESCWHLRHHPSLLRPCELFFKKKKGGGIVGTYLELMILNDFKRAIRFEEPTLRRLPDRMWHHEEKGLEEESKRDPLVVGMVLDLIRFGVVGTHARVDHVHTDGLIVPGKEKLRSELGLIDVGNPKLGSEEAWICINILQVWDGVGAHDEAVLGQCFGSHVFLWWSYASDVLTWGGEGRRDREELIRIQTPCSPHPIRWQRDENQFVLFS